MLQMSVCECVLVCLAILLPCQAAAAAAADQLLPCTE